MKAFLKKNINTISFPKEIFSTLERITNDGFFVYKVRYLVDPIKAIKDNTLSVNIVVSKSPYVVERENIFTNLNSQMLIIRLAMQASIKKQLDANQKNKNLLSFRSDITKKLSNSNTTILTKSNFTEKLFFTEKTKIKPALISDLQKENLQLPILDKNKNTLEESDEIYSNNSIRSASNDLLFNNKLDPSQIAGNKSNNIISTKQSINGTVSRGLFSKIHPSKSTKLLVGTLINKINTSEQFQLNDTDYINVILKEKSRFLEIEETIYIPVTTIEHENFYFILQLKNKNNITQQVISDYVNHSKNISELDIPTIPPKVVVFEKIGLNVINIKQEDKNAVGIKIYRREINKTKPNINASYDFVGSVLLSEKDGFQKIEDIYSSTNPVIYRIIPYNSSEILGAEYASVVTQQKRNTFVSKLKYEQKSHFVSILYEIKENGIEINLKNFPTEPIAVKFLKKNLTIFQKQYEQIGNIILLDNDSNVPIIFEDINVKIGTVYEYTVELIYKDGTTSLSTNSIVVEYSPITNNIISLKTTDPNIVQTNEGTDIQFTIEKDIINTDNDLIKKFLDEQGLTPEFQEQIIENRDKLQDLFAIQITRINTTTGEIEDFGVIQTNQFSDNNLGRVKSVKPLQAGYDYQYQLIAYARNPETLFPNLGRQITTSTNISYELKPYKYKHPITLTKGNIVSTASLKKNYSKTTFTFGYIADRKNINVSLNDIFPSLYEGKAKIIKSNAIMIQWKIQGNVNKIDHFIIVLDINGAREVVGKSHNITENNAFVFIDELTNGESGALTYFIVPVFFDYSRGTELKTNQVVI